MLTFIRTRGLELHSALKKVFEGQMQFLGCGAVASFRQDDLKKSGVLLMSITPWHFEVQQEKT
jgi:hypothetical protein